MNLFAQPVSSILKEGIRAPAGVQNFFLRLPAISVKITAPVGEQARRYNRTEAQLTCRNGNYLVT
jgi:predicted metalloenzyme YecM